MFVVLIAAKIEKLAVAKAICRAIASWYDERRRRRPSQTTYEVVGGMCSLEADDASNITSSPNATNKEESVWIDIGIVNWRDIKIEVRRSNRFR